MEKPKRTKAQKQALSGYMSAVLHVGRIKESKVEDPTTLAIVRMDLAEAKHRLECTVQPQLNETLDDAMWRVFPEILDYAPQNRGKVRRG